MQWLISNPQSIDLGLTVLRVGIGILFIGHGYPKLIGGASQWLWLGQQMGNLGITFVPLFWGFCAALSECVGGICLTLGLGTRIAASFMAFTMFVAVVHHIAKGDSYGGISFPLSQMIIFIALIIAGGGKFSLDYYWFG